MEKIVSDQKRQKTWGNEVETATLGGGCFWCLEPVYEELVGVVDVGVGYAGGMTPDPDYNHVSTGTTGHAEVVQIKFDTNVISYREILEVFFSIHDPTTLNRQGADVGTQYRSVILYHDKQQKETAEQIICDLSEEKVFSRPIVTELLPYEKFYRAEEYHQEYYKKNPHQGYCAVVISPKLKKFRQKYKDQLKKAEA
jgi:peptide-methionine (S)-S-oxide reductase